MDCISICVDANGICLCLAQCSYTGYEHGELALDRNVSLAEAIAFIARAKGVAVDRNMAKNTVQPMVPSNPESCW